MRIPLRRMWMAALGMALLGSMGIERAGAQGERGILPGEWTPPMPELDAVKLAKAKLRRIRISVDFENTTFSEAADYFRQVARELDRHELDPNLKGINVVVRSKELGQRNTGVFKLDDRPLEEVFKKFAGATGAKYYVTDYGVVFEDKDAKPVVVVHDPKPKGKRQEELLFKLENIMVPVVDFDDTTLLEARDFLWSRCRELDNFELDPEKRGIIFEVVGRALEEKSIHELKLRNVSTHAVVQAIAMMAGVNFEVGPDSVKFIPINKQGT